MSLPPLVRDTGFLPLPLLRQGKVRDVYDLGEHLLIIATDRVSAFDVVFPGGVPGKGVLLTQIAAWWFAELARELPDCPHHLLSTDIADLPTVLAPYADRLRGRFMLVRKLRILPVECIVRGYVVGSGWKDYQRSGEICGHRLPVGLRQAEILPAPIFTPATKAEQGHDENIPEAQAEAIIAEIAGPGCYSEVRRRSQAIYEFGRRTLARRGVILADTKFEFGLDQDGRLLLADEILTPDSSRMWPESGYRTGISPPSLDKQYLRDYLETLTWHKQPPAPELPAEVIRTLFDKYREVHQLITGSEWEW